MAANEARSDREGASPIARAGSQRRHASAKFVLAGRALPWAALGPQPGRERPERLGQPRAAVGIICRAQHAFRQNAAGRDHHRIRSRTEEARGSNPLTSTPQQPWSPAWRVTSAGPLPFQGRLPATGSNRLSGCRGTVGPATGRYGAFGAALGAALLAGKMLPPRVVSELYRATSATWTEQPAGPALLPFVRSAMNAHANLDERLVDVNPAVVVTQLVRQARNRSPRWSLTYEVRALGIPAAAHGLRRAHLSRPPYVTVTPRVTVVVRPQLSVTTRVMV
jgi:hypothetical protein